MCAVHETFAHARVAAVEKGNQFRVLHVRDVGLVAGFAAQRLVARQSRCRHTHARHAHAAHASSRDHDGVHLVADVHDARRLVAEALRKAGEDVSSLHHVGIRRNGFHRPSLQLSRFASILHTSRRWACRDGSEAAEPAARRDDDQRTVLAPVDGECNTLPGRQAKVRVASFVRQACRPVPLAVPRKEQR